MMCPGVEVLHCAGWIHQHVLRNRVLPSRPAAHRPLCLLLRLLLVFLSVPGGVRPALEGQAGELDSVFEATKIFIHQANLAEQ